MFPIIQGVLQRIFDGVTYLFQDEFTTSEGAPITSSRTAEPGPGTITFIENDGQFVTSGGNLDIPAQATPADSDLGFYASAQSRTAGLGVFYEINRGDTNIIAGLGWLSGTTASLNHREETLQYSGVSAIDLRASAGYIAAIGSLAISMDATVAIILRSAGAFYILDNMLLWVTDTPNVATVYPGMVGWNGIGTLDYLRVAQLPTPWNTDNGIATDEIASPVNGETFVHEADCIIEFENTTLASSWGQGGVVFRQQDASNFWKVRVYSSGDLVLRENVNGSLSSRANASGVLSGGERIVIICDGETISAYYDNTLAWTYTVAANFKTATGGYVVEQQDGSISNLITWPRTISGTALTGLEKYTGAYDPWSGYWFQDEFTTPDAAPITSPRTAEPGPGTWTITDSGNNGYISGGKLEFDGYVAYDNPRIITSDSYARTAGLCFIGLGLVPGNRVQLGWRAGPGPGSTYPLLGVGDKGDWGITHPPGTGAGDMLNNSNQAHDFVFVLRTSGGFALAKQATDYPSWTLLWVDDADTTTPLWAGLWPRYTSFDVTIDAMRLTQLATPWNSDNDIATDEIASPVTNDTFSHEADMLLDITATTIGVSNMNIKFRMLDAGTDFWRVRITTAGQVLLHEVVSGSSSTRGSSATGAVSNGDRIVIVCDDNDISVYVENTLLFTYGSANNFKTETSGTVTFTGGTFSNLILWPRTLSGSALTELEKYTGAWSGYWFQDEFTTADAAPITSPRTAEPGPGTLTFVETTGTFAISGEKLLFTSQLVAPLFNKLTFYGGAQTRAAGVILHATVNFDATNKVCVPLMWGTSGGEISNRDLTFYMISGGDLQVIIGAAALSVGAYAASTTYQIAMVLRDTGGFFLIKGGAFTEWALLYVDSVTNTATLYPEFSNYTHAGTLDNFRVAQLATPWATDNGIATDSIASPVATNTFTHEADTLLEFTVDTAPTSGGIAIIFREQDSSNRWLVYINNSGYLVLYETVAGGNTQRASTGAGAVTGGKRIVVIADDETIAAYIDNTQVWSYSSAANFKAETSGNINSLGTNGAISNLITWPRTLSGSALTELEEYTS